MNIIPLPSLYDCTVTLSQTHLQSFQPRGSDVPELISILMTLVPLSDTWFYIIEKHNIQIFKKSNEMYGKF